MQPTLLNLKDFNNFLSKHTPRKPIGDPIIDPLETTEELHEWISKAVVILDRRRTYSAALKKGLIARRLTWEKWYELDTDNHSQFQQLLAVWKTAIQKLTLVEERTWADLEGEDGPSE